MTNSVQKKPISPQDLLSKIIRPILRDKIQEMPT